MRGDTLFHANFLSLLIQMKTNEAINNIIFIILFFVLPRELPVFYNYVNLPLKDLTTST